MKSIMHSKDDGTCYLCMLMHHDYSRKFYLHEHHVVFGRVSGRALSEKYGLKIYLCPEHHEFSNEAVHKREDIRIMLCEKAQITFERTYPDLSFINIFGMNYKSKKDCESKKTDSQEFWFLEGEENEQSYISW